MIERNYEFQSSQESSKDPTYLIRSMANRNISESHLCFQGKLQKSVVSNWRPSAKVWTGPEFISECVNSCMSLTEKAPAFGSWWGFPGGSEGAGDPSSVPGLGRSPGEGKWQPIPVFLPGEYHGQRSLEG